MASTFAFIVLRDAASVNSISALSLAHPLPMTASAWTESLVSLTCCRSEKAPFKSLFYPEKPGAMTVGRFGVGQDQKGFALSTAVWFGIDSGRRD